MKLILEFTRFSRWQLMFKTPEGGFRGDLRRFWEILRDLKISVAADLSLFFKKQPKTQK